MYTEILLVFYVGNFATIYVAILLFNTARIFKTDALEQVVFHAGRRNVPAS